MLVGCGGVSGWHTSRGILRNFLVTAWGLPMNFSILALPNKQLLWAKKLEPETSQHASQIQLSHFYWTVQIGSNTQIWPWLITAVEWESSWDGLEFILTEASTWRGLSVLSYVESPLKLLPAIKKYFYQHTKKNLLPPIERSTHEDVTFRHT